jgi:class 3 adenylate cyclase
MARLSSSERARLPDSAFAYVDASGRRRLPIHDESHVRNALARFDRVAFDSEADRERARKRLLNAAKKYGIVPVGFIDGQLRRYRARSGDVSTLPTGFVTFLMTDIEDSTGLLRKLGDRYAGLLRTVRSVIRRGVVHGGGREVDARADEFFAVFEEAAAALVSAVTIQRAMAERAWPNDLPCSVRVGIHSGEATVTDDGYIGLSVHTVDRVATAGHGGQIVVSGDAKQALDGPPPAGVRLRGIGRHRLPGLARAESLFQVEAEGLRSAFPPPRIMQG